MKDLLEVIEEGRDGIEDEIRLLGRASAEDSVMTAIDNLRRETFGQPFTNSEAFRALIKAEALLSTTSTLTSHTKAILTNQIERMKLELKEIPKEGSFPADKAITISSWIGSNVALQTQIDYLESVRDKLN